METSPLKAFATWARTSLIREVTARIAVVLAPASSERVEQPKAVDALEKAVTAAGRGDKGRAAVADKVAYTWFNRTIALRFMDANAYTGVGVVSPHANAAAGQPEILAEAKRGNIDTAVVSNKTRGTVAALLNGTRRSDDAQGEAYALLLADYCRYWNRAMPFMFEQEGDYTELLIPSNLLADDSVLSRAVQVLTAEACQDVEVIGWLYQFYISERHDQIVADFKKSKRAGAAEIPAATQLFTPHWIVRYLVENSLGRLWMLNRPSSRLVDRMDYYIAPVDQDTDFLKISRPEELTVIDPACGSGHVLTYAFDLLHAIYDEEGYAPSEIPGLILTHNLHGTEIDRRASTLTAFALAMKARAKQRNFFSNQVAPNICVIDPIAFAPVEIDFLLTRDGDRHEEARFWNQFENADTFGALIQPDPELTNRLADHLGSLSDSGDLLRADTLERAQRVVKQAGYLTSKYTIVATNPPYMGSGNMSAVVSSWIKDVYPDEKQDLYACFVARCDELVARLGYVAMITGDTWMTIKSFEVLRRRLLASHAFLSFVHMHDVSNHPDIFGANTAFVIGKDEDPRTAGSYIYLDATSPEAKEQHLRDAAHGRAPERCFVADASQFAEIPGSPIAFRMPRALRAAFAGGTLLKDIADARKGLGTGDADRFVRFWWEVAAARTNRDSSDGVAASRSGAKWFPFNKGGEFRKWYGNHDYVVNWQSGGKEIREPGAVPGARAQNIRFYFRPTVSWSKVSSGEPAFRYFPSGWIFSDAGLGLYDEDTDADHRALLALCNSSVSREILKAISPTLNFEAGQVSSLPFLDGMGEELLATVEALIDTARVDSNSIETSPDFMRIAIEAPRGDVNLAIAVEGQLASWAERSRRQQEMERRVNQLVAELYGVVDEVPVDVGLNRVSLYRNTAFQYRGHLSGGEQQQRAVLDLAKELVSYAVGCMFGRYSLDQPGLILGDHGATVRDYLTKVQSPTFKPDRDNVLPLVDGDWFEDDIVARFREFLRAAFGEQHFEENLRFVTRALGVSDIRDYFVKFFYTDHWTRYRKRPVYWLFSSPKGSFNALIYMHRYTPSTVSTVLNEYLREFRAKVAASLLQQERLAVGGGTPRQQAAAQKEADRLRKVLLELEEYEHDVLYPLASRQLSIDLDDGVKSNYPKFGDALRKIPGLEVADE